MPLEIADIWNLQEKPLARLVFHTLLCESDLHRSAGMHKNLDDFRLPPCPDFAIDSLAKVKNSDPDGEAP